MAQNNYDAIIIGGEKMRARHQRKFAPAKVVVLPFYELEWKKK